MIRANPVTIPIQIKQTITNLSSLLFMSTLSFSRFSEFSHMPFVDVVICPEHFRNWQFIGAAFDAGDAILA